MSMPRRIISLTLIALLASGAPSPAVAKSKRHAPPPVAPAQTMPALPPLAATYDIYVGGIHLVAARIWFEAENNAYHTIVKANTYGFWNRLFPWQTVLESRGHINGDRLEPQDFFTRDEWNHKPKITRLTFDGHGGVSASFDPPNTDKNREDVTAEQKRGALDPITALLQMLAYVASHDSCALPVPVFDGKRRFDIAGRDGGASETEGDEYGVYSGKARLCHVDFKMIAGEWKDGEHARFWKKTETESGREPFHIWLASPVPNLPEMPVRLESGSIAGLVVGHLSSWRKTTADELKSESVAPSVPHGS